MALTKSKTKTKTMNTAAIDKLVWVLIYGGLLAVCLGVFVLRSDAGLGWAVIVAGALAVAVGVVLVWVRSRMTSAVQAEGPTRDAA